MDKVKTFQITDQQPISMFTRGSDVMTLKIWRLINSKTKYECCNVNDFEKKFKDNPQKISRSLDTMTQSGHIESV